MGGGGRCPHAGVEPLHPFKTQLGLLYMFSRRQLMHYGLMTGAAIGVSQFCSKYGDIAQKC
jgi:hypothetical protein